VFTKVAEENKDTDPKDGIKFSELAKRMSLQKDQLPTVKQNHNVKANVEGDEDGSFKDYNLDT